MLSFSQFLNERSDHNNRIRVISGWSVVMTLHGVDRDKERIHSLDDDKWNMFFERVVKKIEGFKVASSGEYLYSSMGLKINAVLNVDIEKKANPSNHGSSSEPSDPKTRNEEDSG